MTRRRTRTIEKFALLASLYVSQYIPVMFLFEALPVFMRQQGIALDAIGLVPLLGLPLTFKFLWSPLIDNYGYTRWGHYRFWIIFFQLLVAITTVICAEFEIQNYLTITMVGTFCLFLFCSSQDIAADALAVGLLEPKERGMGNGIQTAGNYLGSLIGGGGMLLLLDRWGWKPTMLVMAGTMIFALLPVLRYREPPAQEDRSPQALEQARGSFLTVCTSYWKTLTSFFRRPRMWRWLTTIVLYTMSGLMAATMFRPLLVDLGLSLSEIGLIRGIVGYTAGMFGAIAAGLLMTRLGRKRSLLLFGLLEVLGLLGYLIPAAGIAYRPMLYSIAIAIQFTSSMASTALFTLMMDRSQAATAGTDYTVQTSVAFMGSLGAAAFSGIIAEAIGYQGLFLASVGIGLINLIIIAKVLDDPPLSRSSVLT